MGVGRGQRVFLQGTNPLTGRSLWETINFPCSLQTWPYSITKCCHSIEIKEKGVLLGHNVGINESRPKQTSDSTCPTDMFHVSHVLGRKVWKGPPRHCWLVDLAPKAGNGKMENTRENRTDKLPKEAKPCLLLATPHSTQLVTYTIWNFTSRHLEETGF